MTDHPRPMMDRPRRLRLTPQLRALVRETTLDAGDFIAPIFVTAQSTTAHAITSMPGVMQLPVNAVAAEAEMMAQAGIRAVILFGIPAEKDATGSDAAAPEGIVQQAVRVIKQAVPELVVMTDLCLCEYTDHGHCGIVNGTAGHHDPHLPEGYVLNDPTLEILARIAVVQAEAGADVVAPSGMMDGGVGAIRDALDDAGFLHLPIMSYSAKYASGFYGPFREAAQGTPQFGDRSSHQMDPANAREALREHALDIAEGADILMVKPALAYLDIIRVTRDAFPELPLAAYNVSGEYAMVKAAAQQGWIDERRVVLELLTGMRRAGADLIITYHAKDAAAWLRG
ncbi:MAG: porphobilinogen synthase [Gemmatimonadota bacterium]|nr:porphobilinogen synthase [Gemmatimonadota bacterium]MDH5199106.1 porphobilinogen synthase [Gemmatimonadota bacterium]